LVFDTLDVADMQLADGGISDNSGMMGLLDMDYFAQFCAERQFFHDWQQDLIISSNASAIFEPTWVHFSRLASPQRAIDIGYSHVEVRPLYFEHESTRKYAPPSFELSPGLLIASNKQLTRSAREVEVNGDLVYRGISHLSPAERIWLAKWLINQPAVDQITIRAIESFAKGNGDSSSLLASKLINGQEIERDLYAFLSAKALMSKYSEEEANRVFRLGFFLVALNIGSLERIADITREIRPSIHACPSFR
jgi:hypothetical protein